MTKEFPDIGQTDRRRRIFVDAHCFDKEYQGSRTFIKEIYTLLAKRKDIVLLLAAYDVENLKNNFPKNSNIHFIKYKSRSAFIRLVFDIPFLIKKHKAEFAHFQYISPLVKNCKQVITIHDVLFSDHPKEFPLLYRVIKKILYKRSAAKADILTTVSEYSQHAIGQHLDVKPERVNIIENGVNSCFFENHNKSISKQFIGEKFSLSKYILYVSRIEPRKNHSLLVKAFLELRLYEKDYSLVLLGHKSLKVPALDLLLKSLPEEIRKYIVFYPAVNDEDLVQFYRAADIFIYPSKAEGFGIPPLEAAASKTSVICSNRSAMKNYSFFGSNHVDPSNFNLLKNQLSLAIEKKHSEKDLDAISVMVKKKYSWESSAEKFYQLISKN